MKKLHLFLIAILSLASQGFSQGTTCITADPFCTGSTYTFPNNTGTTAETGPDYGCLTTQPNPAWYYMQVGSSGNISITISQTDNFGNPIDVDFICWGPFANAQSPCTSLLTAANTIDCSYSTAATEVCNIPSAIAGQYYLLLITNYADVAGTITFSQTGGIGNTNCAIVCPTAGFNGYDSSNVAITFPFTTTCDDNQSYTFYAWDSATAGGYITPYYFINVNPTNSYSTNEMHFYEGGSYIGGFYPGSPSGTVPANTNFTGYVSYVSPSNGNIQIELCDPYVGSASDMTYVVVDGASGNTLAGPGTWITSDAGTGGPGGSSCQTITFPASSVTGTATFTCPTCPVGSFVTTDWGAAAFNPAAAGPGTYNITYTWDDGRGCITSATETITVTNPYDATFNYSSTSYCQNASNPIPTVTQSGGIFSSTPAGLAINTTTGAINVSASTPGTYTVQYDRGYGTSSVCGDTQTQTITIVAPPDAGTNGSVTLCSNSSSVNLFSYLGGSPDAGGSWTDPSGNAHSGTLNPATDPSGTYTYTVTGTAPCTSASATVSITINQAPTVSISGTTVICQGQTSSLTATIGGTASSVTWSSSGDGTFSSTTALTTVYTPGANDIASGNVVITVTTDDPSGPCTAASSSVTLTINPLPVANAGADDTLTCAATNITLDGSGSSSGANYSYNWTTPNGNIVSGGTTVNPVVNQVGSYIITVTDNTTGCSSSDTVDVFQDANIPVADAGLDDTLTCAITSVTLDGTGSDSGSNITYSWTTSNGNIVSGGTTTTPVVNDDGTYTITVTNTANGCSATNVVTVVFDTVSPVVNAGPDMIITCNNSTVTADGTGSSQGTGYNYNWTTSNGNIVSGNTTLTPVFNAAGTYTLTVNNNNNGCSATDNMVVTVDTIKPLANAGTNDTLKCSTPVITLDGTASSSGVDYTYQWTTSTGNIISGDTTLTPDVNQTGVYILTVTDTTNGCIAVDSVEIFQDASLPIADAGVDTTLTCTVSSIVLDGTASSQGANYTYQWTTSDGNIVSGANTLTPTIDSTGTYTLTVTNTANGCSATDVITVTVDTVKPVADAGNAMIINCTNSSVTLDGSASSANAGYNWTTLNGNIVSGGTTLTPVVDAAGTYILTVTNPVNGCMATDSVVVTVDTIKPVANAGTDTMVTCNNPVVNLNGSASSGNNYVYVWTTNNGTIVSGDSSLTPVINSGGSYVLTVIDTTNGCSVTDTVVVGEDLSATAVINANPTSGLVPLDVDLTASGGNGTVSWDLGDGTTSSDTSLTHTYNDLGEYVVILTVTTPGGCMASDSITIEVFGNSTLIFPNVFTPNGDGENDFFYFKAENMESLECTIFNRWGELMYSWSNPNGYWDGRTTAGKEAPAGTYFFVMKAKGLDGKEYDQKGSFTLIR